MAWEISSSSSVQRQSEQCTTPLVRITLVQVVLELAGYMVFSCTLHPHVGDYTSAISKWREGIYEPICLVTFKMLPL